MGYIYRADGDDAFDEMPEEWEFLGKWRPSIFMPRVASRITLCITDVRVERLQDITEADAKAEGVAADDDFPCDDLPCPKCQGQGVHGALGANYGVTEIDCVECDTPVKRYRILWNSINGPGSWDANPWVWGPCFPRLMRGRRHDH